MSDERGGTPAFSPLLFKGGEAFPPLSATTRAEFAARSHRAASHAVNQDHYLVTRFARNQETLLTSLPTSTLAPRFDEYAYAMVIADGMGRSGEVASRVAILGLLELALRFGQWRLRVDEEIAQSIIERIAMFYGHIDTTLLQINRAGADVPLHTTLTAVVTGGRDLFFAHVGHSRAYLLRDRALIPLTRDHTHPQNTPGPPFLDLTHMASDLHHILTDALGAGTIDPAIDVERMTLSDGDQVLLCTNGLTDAVSDEDIARILVTTPRIEAQCAALVARAVASGTDDDVTAVVARYHVRA
ncbi:MAG TPA: protein phosphatase 2C domain-containing protein [Vicinamibacterales bacterium]|nr:protein phosphatase 2C domain-containing protein [Vicinamibacterales bacterium]